ncbi:MAG: [protein-PII] uridylyltransferase [Actinomycetes bacterium]
MDYLEERKTLRAAPIGAARRLQLSQITDKYLINLFNNAVKKEDFDKVALIGVGANGRQDLTLGSDFDLVLVHEKDYKIDEIAEKLWYPIWDLGIKLDHSVRTSSQVRNMASMDLAVVLGWLDARTIVGNDNLEKQISSSVLQDWRAFADKRLKELYEQVLARKEKEGELSQLIEPDLKESYGGIRDITILRAVAATWKIDIPKKILDENSQILQDIRDALHTVLDKPSDKLIRQEQVSVAQLTDLKDADQLIRKVSYSGRIIAHHSDVIWHKVNSLISKSSFIKKLKTENRTPLVDGAVIQDNEVVLAKDSKIALDETLGLRLAAASSQAGLFIAEHTLERIKKEAKPLIQPWNQEAKDAFISLLGSGRHLISTWESLDFAGLIDTWFPIWSQVRGCPQNSQIHSFTVDRHLLESAIYANNYIREVSRPDLLLVGSFFHDIGKGGEKDHSDEGAEIMQKLAPNLGFNKEDSEILVKLVQHHLLLPEFATKRDLEDPLTITSVAKIVENETYLDLLYYLTLADMFATGPLASSEWRQQLIQELVEKVRNEIRGVKLEINPHLSKEKQDLVNRKDDLVLEMKELSDGISLTIVTQDQTGLLGLIAGVLSIEKLLVRSARTETIGKKAVTTWRVNSLFGDPVSTSQISQTLNLALRGNINIDEKLKARAEYLPKPTNIVKAKIIELKEVSTSSSVIEVRAHDEPGFLSKVANEIAKNGIDIHAAIVETLGSEVVDVFYVREPTGQVLSQERMTSLIRALDYACNHVPTTV